MTEPTLPPLPDPDDHPQADVILYDGQCRFCRGQVDRLHAWDRGQRLAFLSLHDPRVRERYPDLTYEQLMREMYLVEPNGRRHRGAAVIRYLSRRIPRLWWLAPLLHLPATLPIWQCLYQLVARQRYRWGRLDDCSAGTCAIHFQRPSSVAARRPHR